MSIHALDAVLVELAAASTALERTARPNLKDVKEAKASAKKATDLLGASETFLAYGIYVVTDEPMEPGPALFRPNGEPAVTTIPEAEELAEVPPTLTPLDLLNSWESWTEEERKEHFDAQLGELSRVHQEYTGEAEPLDVTPWLEAWNTDPAFAFRWVLFAIVGEEFDIAEDTTAAVNEWAEDLGKLPALPDELLNWKDWDEADQADEFEWRLDNLLNDVPEGQDADLLREPWTKAFEADRKDTFTRLLVAEEIEPPGFTIPTDEQRDTWMAAHQVPEVVDEEAIERRHKLFQTKLEELEEAGVKESGLKRKAWKKAETAWREAYTADPTGTLDKLLWRLIQSQIVWELPTEEEVAA